MKKFYIKLALFKTITKKNNKEIAKELDISETTVGRWGLGYTIISRAYAQKLVAKYPKYFTMKDCGY